MTAKRPVITIVLGLLALGLVALAIVRMRASAGETGQRDKPRAPRTTAVLVTEVTRRDVPIVLEGIGSALALQSVTIRPQVDGRIDRLFFEEGQPVKQGDVLAQIDPRPFRIALAQARANLARDKATRDNHQGNLERLEKLAAGNFVSAQDVANQRALVATSEAAILGDEASIASAELNLSYARITSPIDGVAGIRAIDPGNFVRAGDQGGIVIVTQLDPIAVLFSLPQDDLPQVARELAEKGQLEVVALDREGLTELARGSLRVIDNQVVSTTATIRLKAVFPNDTRRLWPNLFVKARLLLETRKGALVIPSTAIQRGPEGPFVYVVDGAQTASVRLVQIDLTVDDTAVIGKGLSEGERVVTEGQGQIRPGAKVQVRPSSELDAPAPARGTRP